MNIHFQLHKLPAEPNVVQILEEFWKKYATNQLMYLNEKSSKRHRQYNHRETKKTPEQVHRK